MSEVESIWRRRTMGFYERYCWAPLLEYAMRQEPVMLERRYLPGPSVLTYTSTGSAKPTFTATTSSR